ncbi:MAG: hypothetical protein AAGJ82_08135 [Bacteroidota bacterium]
MVYKNDKAWVGLLAGLIIPFVGYAILLMVLEYLGSIDALTNRRLNFNFASRTTAILALALNVLIAVPYFRNRRANEAIRGVLIATMLYGGAWLFFFGRQLLYPS